MNDNKNNEKEIYAEFLSERIYGSITLLSVNVSLLANIESLTLSHAYAIIIYTTIGLWAASLFAYYTSYRITHGTFIPKSKFVRSLIAHRGIIASSMPSIILLSIAATGLIEVQTALIADIVLAITTMAVMIFQSSRHAYTTIKDKIVSISILVLIGAVIILIKSTIH